MGGQLLRQRRPETTPTSTDGSTDATARGNTPNTSYLWDALDNTGVSYRNFRFWRFGTGPVAPTAPNLAAHTESTYPGYDLTITDQSRLDAYTNAFHEFEATGAMPTMQFVPLPQDHTRGTTPGAPTPKAMVADNDLAVGRLVDLVSHSKYWKTTAIFIVQDDAQAGPDHLDEHRTEALVISPNTQRRAVDSTFYSTVSMLRTMELFTGPTRADADQRERHPGVEPPATAGDAGNPGNGWVARSSGRAAHHPPGSFTVASFGLDAPSSGTDHHSDAASDRTLTTLWQDLYAAGVDVILNGHAHEYERGSRR